jgi:hypothetical protein
MWWPAGGLGLGQWDWIIALVEGVVPPDFRSREGGAWDSDVELLYRNSPMNSTCRYLPIYVELLYRDLTMDSTYWYRYLKPWISQHVLNLV